MMCKKAEFIQAKVSSIDLNSKMVAITRPFDGKVRVLPYDYLVIAIGSTTNFFGNKRIEKNESAQEKLLTMVVVGAGFAGVETIGELNHFVRDSVKSFYHNINPDNIK